MPNTRQSYPPETTTGRITRQVQVNATGSGSGSVSGRSGWNGNGNVGNNNRQQWEMENRRRSSRNATRPSMKYDMDLDVGEDAEEEEIVNHDDDGDEEFGLDMELYEDEEAGDEYSEFDGRGAGGAGGSSKGKGKGKSVVGNKGKGNAKGQGPGQGLNNSNSNGNNNNVATSTSGQTKRLITLSWPDDDDDDDDDDKEQDEEEEEVIIHPAPRRKPNPSFKRGTKRKSEEMEESDIDNNMSGHHRHHPTASALTSRSGSVSNSTASTNQSLPFPITEAPIAPPPFNPNPNPIPSSFQIPLSSDLSSLPPSPQSPLSDLPSSDNSFDGKAGPLPKSVEKKAKGKEAFRRRKSTGTTVNKKMKKGSMMRVRSDGDDDDDFNPHPTTTTTTNTAATSRATSKSISQSRSRSPSPWHRYPTNRRRSRTKSCTNSINSSFVLDTNNDDNDNNKDGNEEEEEDMNDDDYVLTMSRGRGRGRRKSVTTGTTTTTAKGGKQKGKGKGKTTGNNNNNRKSTKKFTARQHFQQQQKQNLSLSHSHSLSSNPPNPPPPHPNSSPRHLCICKVLDEDELLKIRELEILDKVGIGREGEAQMIGCDEGGCEGVWFHLYCLGLHTNPSAEDEEWFCPDCLEKKKKNTRAESTKNDAELEKTDFEKEEKEGGASKKKKKEQNNTKGNEGNSKNFPSSEDSTTRRPPLTLSEASENGDGDDELERAVEMDKMVDLDFRDVESDWASPRRKGNANGKGNVKGKGKEEEIEKDGGSFFIPETTSEEEQGIGIDTTLVNRKWKLEDENLGDRKGLLSVKSKEELELQVDSDAESTKLQSQSLQQSQPQFQSTLAPPPLYYPPSQINASQQSRTSTEYSTTASFHTSAPPSQFQSQSQSQSQSLSGAPSAAQSAKTTTTRPRSVQPNPNTLVTFTTTTDNRHLSVPPVATLRPPQGQNGTSKPASLSGFKRTLSQLSQQSGSSALGLGATDGLSGGWVPMGTEEADGDGDEGGGGGTEDGEASVVGRDENVVNLEEEEGVRSKETGYETAGEEGEGDGMDEVEFEQAMAKHRGNSEEVQNDRDQIQHQQPSSQKPKQNQLQQSSKKSYSRSQQLPNENSSLQQQNHQDKVDKAKNPFHHQGEDSAKRFENWTTNPSSPPRSRSPRSHPSPETINKNKTTPSNVQSGRKPVSRRTPGPPADVGAPSGPGAPAPVTPKPKSASKGFTLHPSPRRIAEARARQPEPSDPEAPPEPSFKVEVPDPENPPSNPSLMPSSPHKKTAAAVSRMIRPGGSPTRQDKGKRKERGKSKEKGMEKGAMPPPPVPTTGLRDGNAVRDIRRTKSLANLEPKEKMKAKDEEKEKDGKAMPTEEGKKRKKGKERQLLREREQQVQKFIVIDDGEDENMADVETGGDETDEFGLEEEEIDPHLRKEMDSLNKKVLSQHHEGQNYQLVGRLGEGTFSSVYKAKDLLAIDCLKKENYQKKGSSGSGATSERFEKTKGWVALKRIYVTSSPERIKNELEILEDLRDQPNTSHLISAFRHYDQVIVVMPYIPHRDFRTFYRSMSLPQIQSFLKAILKGLDACHTMGIIHRDVKPTNFLVHSDNYEEGQLCDFGLAERIDPEEWLGHCLHSLVHPTIALNKGGRRHTGLHGEGWGEIWGSLGYDDRPHRVRMHGKRLTRPISGMQQMREALEGPDIAAWTKQVEKKIDRKKARLAAKEYQSRDVVLPDGDQPPKDNFLEASQDLGWRPWLSPWQSTGSNMNGSPQEGSAHDKHEKMRLWVGGWSEAKIGVPMGKGMVGYPREDKRPAIRANRAGTRGFRAPEVLLKCVDQTTAVDIWSVGVILLCLLTRRFPFFRSNDDIEALMEIGTIFGKDKMQRCAQLHNRTFLTNCPEIENPKFNHLPSLVQSLAPEIFHENRPLDLNEEEEMVGVGSSSEKPRAPKNKNNLNSSRTSKFSSNSDRLNLSNGLSNSHSKVSGDTSSPPSWYQGSAIEAAIDLLRKLMHVDQTRRWTAREALEHKFMKWDFEEKPY